MGKFYGVIGFGVSQEVDGYGKWDQPDIVERKYHGDILLNSRSWQSTENLNDDLVITNQFSIVADSYAYKHFGDIRYIKWMGNLWKVNRVEVSRPRLTLSIGGVYNGPTPATP